jgi:hypothetical protein
LSIARRLHALLAAVSSPSVVTQIEMIAQYHGTILIAPSLPFGTIVEKQQTCERLILRGRTDVSLDCESLLLATERCEKAPAEDWRVMSSPCDGQERPMANSLIVVRKPH